MSRKLWLMLLVPVGLFGGTLGLVGIVKLTCWAVNVMVMSDEAKGFIVVFSVLCGLIGGVTALVNAVDQWDKR